MSDDPFMDLVEADMPRITRFRRDDYTYHVLRALRLAPHIETGRALLRGERVPRTKLDPEWLKAYGL